MEKSEKPISGLAYYIRKSLFDNWKRERAKLLEPKWQRNLDAYNSVLEGVWKVEEGEDWRSKTFVQVTHMKVITAFATVSDMLLQGGRVPFTLILSPWDKVTMKDMAPEQADKIESDIEDMTNLIQQQFADCHADRQLIKCTLSDALYGETYAKRFVQKVVRKGYQAVDLAAAQGIQDEAGQYTRYQKTVEEIIAPAWEYKSVWSIYRDLESDDLQKGVGIIERELACPYDIRQLSGLPYYLKDGIEAAIKDAPEPGTSDQGAQTDKESLPPVLRDIGHRHKTIEKLEFWGRVPLKVAEHFEENLGDDKGEFQIEPDIEQDGNEVEIMATVAGDHVIRYARTVPGERPYYRALWEINLDGAGGRSVADNLEDVQMVLNGLVRSYEDNKKLAANVMAAIKERLISPKWDGQFKPGAKIPVAEECKSAKDALEQIIIQDVGESCLNGADYFRRLGDEQTMLPRILQGDVAEKKRPDTLGEIQLLYETAGKYLGSVIRNQDEGLIEPIVQDFYEYDMEDPSVQKGKGNYIAQALGFTSFQNRVVRQQALLTFLNLIVQNEILVADVSTRRMLDEISKTMDLEQMQLLKTEEEKTQEGQEMQAAEQQQAQMMLQMEEQMKAIETRFQAFLEVVKGEIQMQLALIKNEQTREQGAIKADQAREKMQLDREKAGQDMAIKGAQASQAMGLKGAQARQQIELKRKQADEQAKTAAANRKMFPARKAAAKKKAAA